MPTIDPKDLPPNVSSNGLNITSVRSTLSVAWDRFLQNPSPTTEQLVNQALVNTGRPPLFARNGGMMSRAAGTFMSPMSRLPTQPYTVQRPLPTPAQMRRMPPQSQQSFEQLIAMAGGGMNFGGRPRYQPLDSLNSPLMGSPRQQLPGNLLSRMLGTAYNARSTNWSAAPFLQNASRQANFGQSFMPNQPPSEAMKIWKHIDAELSSLNRIEHRRYDIDLGRIAGETRTGIGAVGRQDSRLPRTIPPSYNPTGRRLGASDIFSRRAFAGVISDGVDGRFGAGGGGAGGGGGGGSGGGSGGGGFFGAVLGGGRGIRNVIRAEEAMLALRAPLYLGRAEHGVMEASRPFGDMRSQIADLTALRSSASEGGSSRLRHLVEGGLLPIANLGMHQPEWMQNLGVTPQMFTESLSRMGGLRPGQDEFGMVKNLRETRLGAGFRMAPEGTVEAMASTGMKYGITGKEHPEDFPRSFSQFLAQGQAGGADIKDLLKSISEATEAQAKTGIKLDLSASAGWAEFLERMLHVNMPTAQSGAMGKDIMTGLAGAGEHPFKDAVTASIISQIIQDTDFKDPEQVKKLFGKSPEEIMKSGSEREQLSLRMLQEDKLAPITSVIAGPMITQAPGAKNMARDKIREMTGGLPGAQGEGLAAAAAATYLGKDISTGIGFMKNGDVGALPPRIPGADKPAEGTLPTDVYRNRVAAETDLLTAMRLDFERFGTHVADFSDAVNAFRRLAGMGEGAHVSTVVPGVGVVAPGAAGGAGGAGGEAGGLGGWLRGLMPGGGAVSNSVPGVGMVPPSSSGSGAGGGRVGVPSAPTEGLGKDLPAPGPGSAADPRGMIPIIRAAAAKYGHDPDKAVRVAQHEGLVNFTGDKGTSFSSFQLHKGGGLGDVFQKQTGLDPSDPKNEAVAIDWSMKNLATTGWGPYHGARRAGIGAREGIGGAQSASAGSGMHMPGGSKSSASAVDDMLHFSGMNSRNPELRQFIKKNIGHDPSLVGWCAQFVNASLASEGIKGTGSDMAASFHKWGHKVDASSVAKGDVLVAPPSMGFSGHVGLATGKTRMGANGMQIEMMSSNTWDPQTGLQAKAGTRWREASSLDIRRADEDSRGFPGLRAYSSGLRVQDASGAGGAGTGDGAAAPAGGGGGASSSVADAFGKLANIVRETSEHLHELGHGARNARSGMSGHQSGGPNKATSPASTQEHSAYP